MSTRQARHVRIVSWVFVISVSAAWVPARIPIGESRSAVAVLDEWGNRITSLGVTARENALRTQVRTTIAQLAMFDADPTRHAAGRGERGELRVPGLVPTPALQSLQA